MSARRTPLFRRRRPEEPSAAFPSWERSQVTKALFGKERPDKPARKECREDKRQTACGRGLGALGIRAHPLFCSRLRVLDLFGEVVNAGAGGQARARQRCIDIRASLARGNREAIAADGKPDAALGKVEAQALGEPNAFAERPGHRDCLGWYAGDFSRSAVDEKPHCLLRTLRFGTMSPSGAPGFDLG